MATQGSRSIPSRFLFMELFEESYFVSINRTHYVN
nr:unnamed protein product [Callosobruchus chinensis]